MNPHWLIRAQLAMRGGRRSQMRIAPDAVPGYIADLRETNAVGDGGGVAQTSTTVEAQAARHSSD